MQKTIMILPWQAIGRGNQPCPTNDPNYTTATPIVSSWSYMRYKDTHLISSYQKTDNVSIDTQKLTRNEKMCFYIKMRIKSSVVK